MSPVYYAKQYNCLLLNCATIVDIGLTFISFSLRLIKLSLIIRAAGFYKDFSIFILVVTINTSCICIILLVTFLAANLILVFCNLYAAEQDDDVIAHLHFNHYNQ